MEELKKNSIHTVTVDGYSSDAAGVCRVDGRAVFVPGAIPGERWEIKLLRVSSSGVYAKGLSLISASPERREAVCPYFGLCGGCDAWHMSYEEELRFKLAKVNDALRRIGKQSVSAREILGSDSVTRYRNKGVFAVAPVGGKAAAGFYRERSHELIPVKSCLIQNELADRAAAAVIDFMNGHAIPAYDEATGRGSVRHIYCRRAWHGSDAVLCIVSARGFGGLTQDLVAFLRERCPELSGIVLCVNKEKGNGILSGRFFTLWGKADMEDELCSLRFRIAPQAFFQIDPPQAERLYSRAMEYALPSPVGLAFDLYCGAGTISLCLAKGAQRVIGAEIVPEAVENAGVNALANGISNAEFICADAGEAAASLSRQGLRPDVVVVDPPRKGMAEAAVEAVASMSPGRIVYVSCDCATLSRDILRFQALGYVLKEVTAVDMFPRTSHVECVALMIKGIS